MVWHWSVSLSLASLGHCFPSESFANLSFATLRSQHFYLDWPLLIPISCYLWSWWWDYHVDMTVHDSDISMHLHSSKIQKFKFDHFWPFFMTQKRFSPVLFSRGVLRCASAMQICCSSPAFYYPLSPKDRDPFWIRTWTTLSQETPISC